jgi:hypothetical protein
MACHERGPLARVEWRWYAPIRTITEAPLEFPLYLEDPHQYQLLSAKSKRLRAAGLSWVKIGKQLKVTDKTAKKGVLVVLFISVLPEVAAAEKDRSVRRFELMG